MTDTLLPRVCILFSDNYKDKAYQPTQAIAALTGKADLTLHAVKSFDAESVTAAIYDLQEQEKPPKYIAVDLPNTLSFDDVTIIAHGVRSLSEKRARNVVFASVKNSATKDDTFYQREHLPIVTWNDVGQWATFNSDDIVRKQTCRKKGENIFAWLWRQLPYGADSTLRL